MVENKYRTKICRYSQEGFWVIRDDKEYFISFAEYPALREVDLSQLTFFTEKDDDILYWEQQNVTVRLHLN